VPGQVGQGYGDQPGALRGAGARVRSHHEPAAVLPVAEGPQLDLLGRQADDVNRPVAVAGQDRAVRLKPRRLADQRPVLETAVREVK